MDQCGCLCGIRRHRRNDGSGRWSISGHQPRHHRNTRSNEAFADHFSATFVRSASGIINETNRVNLAGGHQNEWSPFDVTLQFRPPTNPTCAPTGLVTPPFPYTNIRSVNPNIAGDATKGYFIDGVTYNVCVYYANPAVLTLTGNGSATSAPITTAQTVLYAGKYTNALPNATVGLTVFHGPDCQTGQGFYIDPNYTTTDSSGNYSKPSGTPPGAGLYSARTNVGNNLSNCINIPVTEVPAATGDVGFAVQLGGEIGLLTGNVKFDAQGTTDNATGQLTMTNSLGYSLNGVVTCFNRIDAKTAVFSGTITDATLYATPGYFIAKVIDNGSAGDQIVVFVNEHGTTACWTPASTAFPAPTSWPTLQAGASSSNKA